MEKLPQNTVSGAALFNDGKGKGNIGGCIGANQRGIIAPPLGDSLEDSSGAQPGEAGVQPG